MFPLQFAGYAWICLYFSIPQPFLIFNIFPLLGRPIRFFSSFSRPGVNRLEKKYKLQQQPISPPVCLSLLYLFVLFCFVCFFDRKLFYISLSNFTRTGSAGLGLIGGSTFDCPAVSYTQKDTQITQQKFSFSFQSRSTELRKVETKPKQSLKREFVMIFLFGRKAESKGGEKEKKRDDIDEPNQIPGFTWIMSIERSGGRGILQSKVKVKKKAKAKKKS